MLNHQEVRKIPRLDIVKLKNKSTLYAARKLANACKEMKRLDIDILGISKTRWANNGSCQQSGTTFYYSGADETDINHRSGVEILIKSQLKKYVKSFIPYSERLMLLQLAPIDINIIQAYAPTADRPIDEAKKFYEQLREVL